MKSGRPLIALRTNTKTKPFLMVYTCHTGLDSTFLSSFIIWAPVPWTAFILQMPPPLQCLGSTCSLFPIFSPTLTKLTLTQFLELCSNKVMVHHSHTHRTLQSLLTTVCTYVFINVISSMTALCPLLFIHTVSYVNTRVMLVFHRILLLMFSSIF